MARRLRLPQSDAASLLHASALAKCMGTLAIGSSINHRIRNSAGKFGTECALSTVRIAKEESCQNLQQQWSPRASP